METAADADWGLNKVDRKNIGAFLATLFSWQSKKQTGHALNTEAELASSIRLGRNIKFLRSDRQSDRRSSRHAKPTYQQ
jgi:hypothetical protein